MLHNLAVVSSVVAAVPGVEGESSLDSTDYYYYWDTLAVGWEVVETMPVMVVLVGLLNRVAAEKVDHCVARAAAVVVMVAAAEHIRSRGRDTPILADSRKLQVAAVAMLMCAIPLFVHRFPFQFLHE